MNRADFDNAQSAFWKAVGEEDIEAARKAYNKMCESSDRILLLRGIDEDLRIAYQAMEVLSQ